MEFLFSNFPLCAHETNTEGEREKSQQLLVNLIILFGGCGVLLLAEIQR